MAVGRVYLVGAGPGDPELITERGIRALERADVVLYDALVHREVLRHAKASAVCELVGKRAGQPSMRQDAINARMIEAASAGNTVVRLKGGDPFLFGRGGEEVDALRASGIDVQVIPGVASPFAVAAYSGIPLTDRRYSDAVVFLTASQAESERTPEEWQHLAAVDTLVLFMAGQKVVEIAHALLSVGRASDTAVAIVESASLPSQRTRRTTLGAIARLELSEPPRLPSLVVVGAVVTSAPQQSWFERLPLFGRRILILRPEAQAESLMRMLRDQGAEPIAIPAIEIAEPTDVQPFVDALRKLHEYAWVVFTSANGVRATFSKMRTMQRDARAFAKAKICAIGPKTAAALELGGLRADLVPDEYRGEAVASSLLQQNIHPGRVLILRALVARNVLPDTLRASGIHTDVVAAYETKPPSAHHVQHMQSLLREHPPDTVVFTSPSTVANFFEVCGDGALASRHAVAIGPITGDALRSKGVAPLAEASEYTAEGIVEALIRERF